MKPNPPVQQQLLLYLVDELGDAERAEVEALLQKKPAYRAMLEDMRALREAARARLPEPPEEEVLTSLNRVIAHRIQVRSRARETRPQSGGRLFRWFFRPTLLVRVAAVAPIFALGFLLGSRSGHRPAPPAQEALLDMLVTRMAAPEAAQEHSQPWLVDLERVSFGPGADHLNVQYTLVHEARAEGTLEHNTVRQVLRWALLQDDNATIRLHAVKAIGAFVAQGQRIDAELLTALLGLVESERRPAVRLHIVRVLAPMASVLSVRQALMQVVQEEQDAALRIEAFEALVRGAGGQASPSSFWEQAKANSNAYIRHRAFALEREARR